MTAKVGQSKKVFSNGKGHEPIKPVLYARVSTQEQKRRESIQTQVDEAQQWCERQGLKLIAIYKDEGVSGTVDLEKREAGARLLADAVHGKFDRVLLFRFDRLGRKDGISHVAKELLETRGVFLIGLKEGVDTSTPTGALAFSLFTAFSAEERRAIRERVVAGTDRAMKAGKWGGIVPYGYKQDNG